MTKMRWRFCWFQSIYWIFQNIKDMSRKLLKFLILFDNTSLLYFPGQFLSGRVLLELQDETPALGELCTLQRKKMMMDGAGK